MKKTDKLHKEIAESAYNNFEVGEKAYTKQGYLIGTTIDYAYNVTGNGEKIYTIVSDGTIASPKSSSEKRLQIKELTLLFQGSTNPLKFFLGKHKEVIVDWKNNNLKIKKYIEDNIKDVPMQLKAASGYLQHIMKVYPNAKINIYGHSLGSMNAQYALASVMNYHRINYAHIYNAPNIYTLLTNPQKLNISKLYSKIYNYVDLRDRIAINYTDENGAVGQVFKFNGVNKVAKPISLGAILLGPLGSLMGYSKGTFLDQHMWGGYTFDADENLIDENGKRVYPLVKPRGISKFE